MKKFCKIHFASCESTTRHCLDILIRLIRVANSPHCLLCIRNSNRRGRGASLNGSLCKIWGTTRLDKLGESDTVCNRQVSPTVLFRTVTPTHFPRCGLFSQQVIKLLECSTDSGEGLWQRERGKIKRKWVVRSKIGSGKMGANVTRFVVSRWVNFKLNDTEQWKIKFCVAL